MTTDIDLIERREVRASYVNDANTEVLTKIKALALLPDGIHASTEQVAAFYEVPVKTVSSLVTYHRDEFKENGYRSVSKRDGLKSNLSPAFTGNRAWLAIFNRRAILLVGMLLRDSTVAKQVRAYLLNTESVATHRQAVSSGDYARAAEDYDRGQLVAEVATALAPVIGEVVSQAMKPVVETFERVTERNAEAFESALSILGYENHMRKVEIASIQAGDPGEPNQLYVRRPIAKPKSFIVNAHDPGEGWIKLHDAMDRKTTASNALRSAGYLEQTKGSIIIREGGPWWDRSDLFCLCVYPFRDKKSGERRTARVSYANEAGTDEVRRVLTTLGVRI